MTACALAALTVAGGALPAVAGTTDTSTSAPATGTTTDIAIHTADGRDRTARVYVPASLATDRRAPLLVALHGGTGWGTQFERTSGYDALADAHGFIVTYPDGIGIGPAGDRLRTWNGGVCCGPAVRQNVDDVAFLKQLVATISDQHRIDPTRVFATGHSNGMIMAYRLLCEAADVFVAAAGQAGTLGVDSCSPSHPVSLRHIHGTADTNIPIDGGRGSTSIAGIDFPSPSEGISTFAVADGCAHGPEDDEARSGHDRAPGARATPAPTSSSSRSTGRATRGWVPRAAPVPAAPSRSPATTRAPRRGSSSLPIPAVVDPRRIRLR